LDRNHPDADVERQEQRDVAAADLAAATKPMELELPAVLEERQS
jgi:hypothetical protein